MRGAAELPPQPLPPLLTESPPVRLSSSSRSEAVPTDKGERAKRSQLFGPAVSLLK